jgi:hypothetical protein
VALIFSQLVFQPDPLGLLRRVEASALKAMASGLDLTAQALEGDDSVIDRAIGSQRDLRDQLSELARIRRASTRIARHGLTWRGQIKPLVRENVDAGHLDLLGGSCLLLTRTSLAAGEEEQRLLAPFIVAFSQILTELSEQPGDREKRQRAVDRSLGMLRTMGDLQPRHVSELFAAVTAVRIAVMDLMLFVGVPSDEARAATRGEEGEPRELEVPPSWVRERRLARARGWLRRQSPNRESPDRPSA